VCFVANHYRESYLKEGLYMQVTLSSVCHLLGMMEFARLFLSCVAQAPRRSVAHGCPRVGVCRCRAALLHHRILIKSSRLEPNDAGHIRSYATPRFSASLVECYWDVIGLWFFNPPVMARFAFLSPS